MTGGMDMMAGQVDHHHNDDDDDDGDGNYDDDDGDDDGDALDANGRHSVVMR